MPQLTEYEYNDILNLFNLPLDSFNIFIETGTHYGQTLKNIKHKFLDIHSVELSNKLYQICKNTFQEDEHIKLYCGDSSILLSNIIQKIEDKAVFWLDGHFSGGDTAKGNKDCPLIEEIESINEKFKYESLIIIDDYRLFGTNINENWSDINTNTLNQILKNRVKQSLQVKDRLIYLLSAIA